MTSRLNFWIIWIVSTHAKPTYSIAPDHSKFEAPLVQIWTNPFFPMFWGSDQGGCEFHNGASGIHRWHRSLGGPGFTAQQFIMYTLVSTLFQLEFVTCRFILFSIKTPLQACGEILQRETRAGNIWGEAWNERLKRGTKLSLMTVRELEKVHVSVSPP